MIKSPILFLINKDPSLYLGLDLINPSLILSAFYVHMY